MRKAMLFALFGIAALSAISLLRADAEPIAIVATPDMDVDAHVNLQRNLRWVLAQERESRATGSVALRKDAPRVGIFADAGCWHVGARSVAELLRAERIPVRIFDRDLLLAEDSLRGIRTFVLPGGWAPHQRAALGSRGLARLRHYVVEGGRILGICAGAYLLAREVHWEGALFADPEGLWEGRAEGPLDGLARWPERAGVRLRVTDEGARRGLASLSALDVLYYGGGRFPDRSGITALALYPDGSPAISVQALGKGELVACGVHLERPPPALGGDESAALTASGPLLRALLRVP